MKIEGASCILCIRQESLLQGDKATKKICMRCSGGSRHGKPDFVPKAGVVLEPVFVWTPQCSTPEQRLRVVDVAT